MHQTKSMEPERRPPVVLMVEDNDSIADILSFILHREAFEVVLLPDGRAAELHIAESSPPDVVLLDVILPYVDGFQLVSKIRSQPGWRSVPVIMLTGTSDPQDISRALAAGADAYIAKPFEPKELVARLRAFIKGTP